VTTDEPWGFAFLGLSADADERAVKRAYAQKLKRVRPEEDPVGFQALHGEYQAALAHLQWKSRNDAAARGNAEAHDDPPATNSGAAEATDAGRGVNEVESAKVAAPLAKSSLLHDDTEPSAPTKRDNNDAVSPSVSGVEQPAFDLTAFYAELLREARARDSAALTTWIASQEALWSFELKADAGYRILQQLFQDVPPMGPAQFDALLAFFDLDHVFAVRDPLAIENLREAMAAREEIQSPSRFALERRMKRLGNFHGSETAHIMEFLSRPFTKHAALWAALNPGRAGKIARFVRLASRGRLELLSPPIDQRWPLFWVRVAEMNWVRAALGIVRCTIVFLLVLTCTAIGAVAGHSSFDRWLESASIVTLCGLTLAGLWLYYVGFTVVTNWQALPQRDATDARGWIRWLFLPGLCIALSLATYAASSIGSGRAALLTVFVGVSVLRISIRRYRVRAHSRPINLDWRVYWFLLIVGSQVARVLVDTKSEVQSADNTQLGFVVSYLLFAGTFVAWLLDAWKQRRWLGQERFAAP